MNEQVQFPDPKLFEGLPLEKKEEVLHLLDRLAQELVVAIPPDDEFNEIKFLKGSITFLLMIAGEKVQLTLDKPLVIATEVRSLDGT